MPTHASQTDAEGLHRPKGFDGAANDTALVKNSVGELEYRALSQLGATGPQGPAGGAVEIINVADIKNPTELATEVGSMDAELYLVREADALADDKFELYMWDASGTVPDNSPYTIPSTGGGWIKYGVEKDFLNYASSTGIVSGGTLSVGAVNTTFDLSDGFGIIVDNYTDPANPTTHKVSWTGKQNIPVDNLATNLITFVSVDKNGDVIQQTSRWTDAETRDKIIVGVVVHVDKTIVDTVNPEHHSALDPAGQAGDILEGLGFLNLDGNLISPNGANMSIDKSAGVMMGHGINFYIDPKNPHKLSLAGVNGASFQYRFSNGDNGTTGTILDPDNLDDGAGGLTPLANNRWSIQRVYIFTSNNVKIQRGVESFTSRDAAIAGIATEAYVTEPSIAANGLLRGFIITQKGATDLSTQATFIQASKYQTIGGSSTGIASTQQTAYNNSLDPEIVTDADRGAMTYEQGAAAPTMLQEFKDNTTAVKGYIATDEWKVNTQAYSSTNTLADGVSIATDCSLGNVHTVTLAGNRSLLAPTNLKDGATYIWIIKQDVTGSRTLVFDSVFKFAGGAAPALTTDPNGVDILSGVSDGTNIYCSLSLDFK